MVNEKIFNVFFRAKPAMLLLNLKNAKSDVYASTVAKGIDCTILLISVLLSIHFAEFLFCGNNFCSFSPSGVALFVFCLTFVLFCFVFLYLRVVSNNFIRISCENVLGNHIRMVR